MQSSKTWSMAKLLFILTLINIWASNTSIPFEKEEWAHLWYDTNLHLIVILLHHNEFAYCIILSGAQIHMVLQHISMSVTLSQNGSTPSQVHQNIYYPQHAHAIPKSIVTSSFRVLQFYFPSVHEPVTVICLSKHKAEHDHLQNIYNVAVNGDGNDL